MALGMWSAGVQEQHPISGENPFTSGIKSKNPHGVAIPSFAFFGFHLPFVVDHHTRSPCMPHLHQGNNFFRFSTRSAELVAGAVSHCTSVQN